MQLTVRNTRAVIPFDLAMTSVRYRSHFNPKIHIYLLSWVSYCHGHFGRNDNVMWRYDYSYVASLSYCYNLLPEKNKLVNYLVHEILVCQIFCDNLQQTTKSDSQCSPKYANEALHGLHVVRYWLYFCKTKISSLIELFAAVDKPLAYCTMVHF